MSRRFVKRLVAVFVIIMVLPTAGSLLYHQSIRWAGEARLRKAEADLDRTDPGWRLDDIVAAHNAKVPPDDQNLTKLCWDASVARPEGFDKRIAARGAWLPFAAMNRLPDADKLDEARELHASAEQAVSVIRTARQRSRGGWVLAIKPNPLETSLEHVQRVRAAADLLELDAVLAATDGEPGRASDSTADLLHLCNAVGDEPLLISQLARLSLAGVAVATCERLVGWRELPSDKLAMLQTGCLTESESSRLPIAFRGERAFFHRLFAALDDNRITLTQISGDPDQTLDSLARWRFAAHIPDERAYSLEYHTRLMTAAVGPPHQVIDALTAVEPPPNKTGSRLSRLSIPAVDKVSQTGWRVTARLRSAAVGLACERFRQANNRWPNDLAELKELLPTIPPDPYDGEPLRYRKLADGVVVYSVGPDRQDDGGTLSYGNPQPGEDVGFRLWDVAARRQPAAGE